VFFLIKSLIARFTREVATMKKTILLMLLAAIISSPAYASELVFSGVCPVPGAYEWGLGGGISKNPPVTGNLDSSTFRLELFYRKFIEDSLDWGFSLSPIDLANFPGTLNFIFDLKCRLLKESSGVIPNIVLGVNMVNTTLNLGGNNANVQFSFLDSGRLGFSWTFEQYEYYQDTKHRSSGPGKRTEFYVGTYIVNQAINTSNIYFGVKKGSLNFLVNTGNGGINFIGLSFVVSS
jgi:hypothetical protein